MTTYTWRGGSRASWADDENWIDDDNGKTPAGPPGPSDVVWVPSVAATLPGNEQENLIIETAGQTVGQVYGATIGSFPVYNSDDQFQYIGTLDSFTTLRQRAASIIAMCGMRSFKLQTGSPFLRLSTDT